MHKLSETHTLVSGKRPFGFLQHLMQGLIDVIYPNVCLGCRCKLDTASACIPVCAACWSKIRKNAPPFCWRCGRQLKAPYYTKNICGECAKKKLYFDRAYVPCAYEGVIKELIAHFKYQHKDYLAPVLSKLMLAFIRDYGVAMEVIDYIIPIPLSREKLREREFNQAQLLAVEIARTFHKTARDDIVTKHRHTTTQTSLSAEERLANVEGSFSVARADAVKGKNILLVDDVLTTGATASEAARVLKLSGAGIVFVVALAN